MLRLNKGLNASLNRKLIQECYIKRTNVHRYVFLFNICSAVSKKNLYSGRQIKRQYKQICEEGRSHMCSAAENFFIVTPIYFDKIVFYFRISRQCGQLYTSVYLNKLHSELKLWQ
jgi:hypothetical protein